LEVSIVELLQQLDVAYPFNEAASEALTDAAAPPRIATQAASN